jgi:phage terminase large subunit-like protein
MEIANIAFKQAKGTIKLDPDLSKLFHIQDHKRQITHRRSGAILQIKAADTDVITGSKATGTMIDETHVFAKKANAADVFVEIRGALTARPDGFLFQTTTQSKAPPTGVFRSELAMARNVGDGKIRLPLLPILYELPLSIAKNDGWKHRKYWRLVNPNMDRSVDEEFLSNEMMKAELEGPAKIALIASQHFNVEIGLSLLSDRWAGANYWLRRADPTLSLDEILVRCEVVVVGIDGGGLDDLLGFGVMGREKGTGHWLHWGCAWVHKDVLEIRKSEAPKLLDLAKTNDLKIVEDLSLARTEIADYCERIEETGLLAEKDAIGVDQMGIGLIVQEIASREIDGDRIVGIPQGWMLNGAIKTAEVKLSEGTLVHSNQELMVWAVGNAKVEAKGNAITITKQTAGTAKIDPLMAFFNCVGLMSKNPDSRVSAYEDEEMVI